MPLQVLQVLRALEYKAKDQRIVVLGLHVVGQTPFGSPSVFNFYQPEYRPPGTHQLSNMFIQVFMHLPAKSAINYRVILL